MKDIIIKVKIEGELSFSSMAYSIKELQEAIDKVVKQICNVKGSITVKEVK